MNNKLKLEPFQFWRDSVTLGSRLPILDVRSIPKPLNFAERDDDVIVQIPQNELSSRNFELPPRNFVFALLIDESCDLKILVDILLARKPWKVAYGVRIVEEDTLDASATTKRLHPHPRLWQPDSMVQNILLPILQKNSIKEIWDLGAGAGRDVCFLAESLPETTIVAYDHRYRLETDPIHAFFHRRQVDGKTRVCCADASTLTDFTSCQCFYMVRYWCRALGERIARDAQPSTIIAISQFGKPAIGAPWPFPHPKEQHVLERNELAEMFADWSILYDEVATDSDHGRTLIQFVAQKRADS